MSVKCISAVLDSSQHAGTELLMLVVLADYSDDDGNSYPAVASLARKCRTGQRNANYVLNALQASGELRVLKNEGPKGTNRYRIMLSKLGIEPLQPTAPLKRSAPLQPSSGTPATQFPKPLHPSADEPSLNRQEPSSRERKRSKKAATVSEHPLFGEFYLAYPRKVARSEASKAFNALKPDAALLAAMLQAMKGQRLAEKCAAGEVRYVPHPATWLNKRRWEDEVREEAEATFGAGSVRGARISLLSSDEVFTGAAR